MSQRALLIGECMVELRQAEGGLLRKGFAGDTFNTAYYMRAFLPGERPVDYFTAVGTDTISDELLAFVEGTGVGTGFVRRVPERSPGLYMIHLKDGERSFSYWRSASAARLLADDPAALRAAIDASDVILFSGITLAILSPDAVETLLSEIGRAKAGGKLVAFDPNIRPRLWDDAETMRRTISAGAAAATIVMPSFEDEATHFGDASIAATIARYRALGAENLVVKDGAEGITLDFGGAQSFVAAARAQKVVDTTGAGDSFNGAFLAKYLETDDPRLAAEFAARVAATVIAHHGALLPPAEFQALMRG
ncbi:2-dehydro-3-deoxygluconokinase [Aminobacter sp. DSM 101952]|uniref:sugar kinase n=1 Tax=Aminobacter sp. DSM 101952 TaxID=2735891 RepID=UPI0006FBD127|nr:sugar kinase [Aminobacter sp. DSM 101952]KQU75237.1 2-dehydro-3-deoxygluconokinase [Aminobacter sp. DSM 101952]